MNKEFQLEGQMSIFDFPEALPDDEPYIDRVARTIKEETGISFEKKDEELTRTYGTYTLRVHLLHYNTTDERNGRQFISVGYFGAEEGASCPCDSLEEAVNHVKQCVETIKAKNEKIKAEREAQKQKKPMKNLPRNRSKKRGIEHTHKTLNQTESCLAKIAVVFQEWNSFQVKMNDGQ